MHFPSNHPLRRVYRGLAFVTGVFMLVLGAVGFFASQGDPLFGTSDATALGLPTNPAFSYASLAAGALVVLATGAGRNIDRFVYLWIGTGHLLAGTAMLLLIGRPEYNYLNFTLLTCIISFAIGTLLGTAGMYAKIQRS